MFVPEGNESLVFSCKQLVLCSLAAFPPDGCQKCRNVPGSHVVHDCINPAKFCIQGPVKNPSSILQDWLLSL